MGCGKSCGPAARSCGRSFCAPSGPRRSSSSGCGRCRTSACCRRSSPRRSGSWSRPNQINDKVIAALEQNSPLGRVLAAGLANRHRPREIMMERLEDTGRHVVHELERFLNTLGTIAVHLAAARPARHRHRHHPGLQRHPGGRHGRSARALGRHRRGADHHRGRPVRRDSRAVRLPLPARQGGAHRDRDGEGRDPARRCARGRRRARRGRRSRSHEPQAAPARGARDQPDLAHRRRAAARHVLHAVEPLHGRGPRARPAAAGERAGRASRRPSRWSSPSRSRAATASTSGSSSTRAPTRCAPR